jgi:fimbrial chaperone protein
MLLKPTDDIVYFPALLALPPREARKIRVGTVARAESVEKSYRLFVEQLPEPDRGSQPQSSQVRVKVLTKMGIPIFVQPHKLSRAGEIAGLTMAQGLLRFQIKNTGNTHFQARKIRVTGLAGPGNPQFNEEISGWYILAGGVRDYEIPIPTADCRRTRQVEITVATEHGELKETFSPPPDACGTPPVPAGTANLPSGANRRAQPPSPSAARRSR